jgi:hypothetical protein
LPATLLAATLLIPFAAQAQVTLEVKRLPGSASQTTEQLAFEQTMVIMGMNVASAVDSMIVSTNTVGEATSAGETPVTVRFDSIVSSYQLPGGANLQYDSKKENNKVNNPMLDQLVDVLDATVGMELTYRVNEDSEVAGVDGVDEALKTAPAAVAELLKGELDAEKLAAELQQEIDRLPDDAVNVGDTWTRTEVWNIGQGQALTFEREYQYAGTVEEGGKTYDQITFADKSVTFSLAPNPALPLTVTKSDLKVDSSEGTLLFDREAGNVVKNEVNAAISGSMTLSFAGQAVPADLKLSLSRSTSVGPAAE